MEPEGYSLNGIASTRVPQGRDKSLMFSAFFVNYVEENIRFFTRRKLGGLAPIIRKHIQRFKQVTYSEKLKLPHQLILSKKK